MNHLFLLFLLLIPATAADHLPLTLPLPDNETIYNISKSLCFNCWAEALQFLFYHNIVRLTHFQLPLAWDSQLEYYASAWAHQRQHDCKAQHSFPEGKFQLGENIFVGSSGWQWTPADAVHAWAGEEKDYSYLSNSCSPGKVCGHYTQLVWSSTRRVGCARIVCDGDGGVFISCNYDPPGNVIGERPY